MQSRKRLPVMVISVGNLVVGGTGKTPVTLWIAHYLQSRGMHPAVLSRGYGRHHTDVSQVPSEGETSSQGFYFGDEPVLMAHQSASIPVWVGRKRYRSGLAAVQCSKADVLILDDGFQHLALARDFDLVLLDAHQPFGNGSLLPLGPLREPVAHLNRADAILLTRADDPQRTARTRSALQSRFPGKPVFACTHRITGFRSGPAGANLPVEVLQSHPVVAFAGIAHPNNFFESLEALGLRLCDRFAFPDHYRYGIEDLKLLADSLSKNDTPFLVTTEKDAIRLPTCFQVLVVTADLRIDFGPEHQSWCHYLQERLHLGHKD